MMVGLNSGVASCANWKQILVSNPPLFNAAIHMIDVSLDSVQKCHILPDRCFKLNRLSNRQEPWYTCNAFRSSIRAVDIGCSKSGGPSGTWLLVCSKLDVDLPEVVPPLSECVDRTEDLELELSRFCRSKVASALRGTGFRAKIDTTSPNKKTWNVYI